MMRKKLLFKYLSQVNQSENLITDTEINNYIRYDLGRKLSINGTNEKLSP
jgi:hypothetical protein